MKRTSLPSIITLLFAGAAPAYAATAVPEFRLPQGFAADVLVDGIEDPRAMALGDDGILYVSTLRAGKVYAVRDALGGSPEVVTIATGLKMPNGIAYYEGDLYVATVSRLLRWRGIASRLAAPGDPDVVDAALPAKGKLHAWKYLGVGPDGKLYVSLGVPCNVCDEPDLSVMLRMDLDGGGREVFARGIRNSVGFDWHPETGELWFTDNGRDMMGDDMPPCELNRVSAPGQHFGFPFCHGTDIADPELGGTGRCEDAVAPAQELTPHSAPLGMRFYTGSMFPAEYRNQVFIAEHGSWNRSEAAGKTGYRVTLVRLNGNHPVSYEPFMEGFLAADGKEIRGRPVDIVIASDGSLLVSDDMRGAIYRIHYTAGGDG